jgi:uncharacterized membrane-anchored protein
METKMRRLISLAVVAMLPALAPANAQQDPQAVLDSLNYRQGEIVLGDNLATLTLTPAFRYIDGADTKKLLVDVWGNPPGAASGTLGAMLPTGISPLAPEAWAMIITYEDSGHVPDDDAAGIDYDELLREMQQSIRDGSEERVKQGYEKLELVGWAQPPRYDSQAKKLYWARQLKFGDSPDDTLNYEIRALGRAGVLDLNIVAGMSALPEISGRIDEILGVVAFNPGSRYEDFQQGTDKVAEYGIAGLIAGGILAKAGFFKFLLGAGKFIILGILAVGGAVVGKFLRRKPTGES